MTLSKKNMFITIASVLVLFVSFMVVNMVPGLSKAFYGSIAMVWFLALLTFVVSILPPKDAELVKDSDYDRIYQLTR